MEGSGSVGRLIDWESKCAGLGFNACSHCVVFLSKKLYLRLVLVQTRKTHPNMTEKLLTGS